MKSLVVGVLLVLCAAGAHAQGVSTVRMASGLDRPVFLTSAPGSATRAFVIEQHLGQIRILRLGSKTVDATPFLTVPGVSTGDEQGLLGLAFDPDYANNGFFYVNYTDPDTKVVRYHVSADPDVADPGSATPVLSFDQPQDNHNGGWMAFGPDGFLYISTGDGGGSFDQGTGHTAGIGNGQDVNVLLGKILRIDPSGDDFPGDPNRNYAIPPGNPFAGAVSGADEIWAYGLRNPWRNGFDRATGDLYIGDVGQGACEEVNVHPAGTPAGANYGWRLREGVIQTPNVGGPRPLGAIDPIMDYPHGSTGNQCSDPPDGFTGIAVTGGYVYRGPASALQGIYFFADFGTGNLWSLRYDGSNPSTFDGTNYTELTDRSGQAAFTPDVGTIDTVSSFGEDATGNLYVLDLGGEVFFIPEPPAALLQLSGVAATLVLARRRRGGSPAAG